MALKRTHPELRVSGQEFQVTADEQDAYQVFQIINPVTINANAWIGTYAVAGTSATNNLVIINAIPDYPRNLEYSLAGSAAGMSGTTVVTGRDQFGQVQTEIIALGTAANGGTQPGTKVFAQVTSATHFYGTAVGSGTARLGLGTTGTTALFGLPFRVGGTTDLKLLSVNAGTGGVTVNGGTIAAFIDVPRSALKLPVPQTTGTMAITAWVKPTFVSETIVAGLPQRT